MHLLPRVSACGPPPGDDATTNAVLELALLRLARVDEDIDDFCRLTGLRLQCSRPPEKRDVFVLYLERWRAMRPRGSSLDPRLAASSTRRTRMLRKVAASVRACYRPRCHQ